MYAFEDYQIRPTTIKLDSRLFSSLVNNLVSYIWQKNEVMFPLLTKKHHLFYKH